MALFRLLKTTEMLVEQYGFLNCVKMIFQYIFHQLLFVPFLPYAMNRIRKINKNNSLDELIDFTFTFSFEIIRPFQFRSELLELLKMLDKKKPKYILEIGTANGGTLFLFTRIASENAVIISIDLPSANFGGGYSIARIPLYKAFALNNQHIHLIRKDSHKEETLKEIKEILNGNKIDFLFIDGDHTYKGIKRDFELYSTIVKKNGIIALHDIIESNVKGFEVSLFWDEIKPNYDIIEIAENRKQNIAGIGIILN